MGGMQLAAQYLETARIPFGSLLMQGIRTSVSRDFDSISSTVHFKAWSICFAFHNF